MQSEPRVVVISSNTGRWSARERLSDYETQNGVEAWVHAFQGDYIGYEIVSKRDIQNYDIVIANTTHIGLNHLPKLISLGESRPASVKWVTLIEGSATDYLKPNKEVVKSLNLSDLVNVINRYTVSFFQAMTHVKCAYIGIPYPVEHIAKMALPVEKRRARALLCTRLARRWSDYFVANAIGIESYGYEQRISRKLKRIHETWALHKSLNPNKYFKVIQECYRDNDLEVRRDVGQREFFIHNADAFMWINLDDRYTWGRYVLDAAALRIPIITTRSTGHGEDLFPETTLEDEFQVDKAVAIGKRLLCDPDFYHYVATYPIGKMEHLKHQPMKLKLLSHLT